MIHAWEDHTNATIISCILSAVNYICGHWPDNMSIICLLYRYPRKGLHLQDMVYSIQYSFLINTPRHKITTYKSSWLICDPRCCVKTAYPDYGKVDFEDFIKYFVLHAIQSNKYNILSVLERGRLGAYPNPVMLIGLRTTKRVQVKLNHDLTMVKYAHHAKSLYLYLFVMVSSHIYFPC